jgi:hemerythrin
MAFMAWDPSLETGIDIIDQQHQGIVKYINELHDAAATEDRSKVSQVLEGLIHYTVSHFAFEEDLLNQHGYPLLDAHKKVHRNFIARIENYKNQHENGKNIAKPLSGELQLWLASHIKTEDNDYVNTLNIKSPTGSKLSAMVKKFFGK